jgi:Xaa-Pro aminopeptidase
LKRGLITWDREEIPFRVFGDRIDAFRDVLRQRGLPAGAVYSDLWRANQVRSLQNFMPYFNRALLIVPVAGEPTLLCGLSPRVYKWIQSVTPITEVRAGKNFAGPLEELATDRGWSSIGILDEAGLPFDMHAALMNTHLELVNVESETFECPAMDAMELAMRRKSVEMARVVLESEIAYGAGRVDYELVGHLERFLRRAGAEDLIVLVGHDGGSPSPSRGRSLEEEFSVSLALEYRGHWTRISRTHSSESQVEFLQREFERTLQGRLRGQATEGLIVEDLSTGYPYEFANPNAIRPGTLAGIHVIPDAVRGHLIYGDTCIATETGWSLLGTLR